MAVAPVKPRLSREEYLAWERASKTKHELRNGEIIAMSGASREHKIIAGNAITSLNVARRDRPCVEWALRLDSNDCELPLAEIYRKMPLS
jgi:Uma2 family endonuclease